MAGGEKFLFFSPPPPPAAEISISANETRRNTDEASIIFL